MSQHYRAPANNPRPKNDQGPLVMVQVFISRETFEILKAISEEQQVPVSRLIAQSIDNELDYQPPFNFPVEPTTEFVEGSYTEEAQKIYQFLVKHKKPMDKETLMLCRRDIGIDSRDVFKMALKELLNTSLVEEYKPKSASFHYSKDYRRIRVVQDDPRDLKKSRYKKPATQGEHYE